MAGEPTSSIFIGSAAGGANPQHLELKRANRHGLIAGGTHRKVKRDSPPPFRARPSAGVREKVSARLDRCPASM